MCWQEAWICKLGLDNISTSLQYANHFYPDADSLQPTRIVCAVGSAVCGECTHWVALAAPHLPGLRAAWEPSMLRPPGVSGARCAHDRGCL